MALLLKAGQGPGSCRRPHEIPGLLPPFAVILSVTLVLLIARALSFGIAMAAVLALCVALSPLTQGLHGIGSVDHHFAEYILILSAVAAFLWWMRRPDSLRHAAFVGACPGLSRRRFTTVSSRCSCPVLGALAILWIRGISPSPAAAASFGLALLLLLQFSCYCRLFRFASGSSISTFFHGSTCTWPPARARLRGFLSKLGFTRPVIPAGSSLFCSDGCSHYWGSCCWQGISSGRRRTR